MVSGDAAEKAAYERLVAEFRQRHPDIDVTLIHIPGQSDELRPPLRAQPFFGLSQ
ncbi:MAG: hypothetical protein NZM94_12765 [Roseiflexus sp.]|nr:hypothetical protein [Roseiflexus sp.]